MGQLSRERLRKFEDNAHLYYDWLTVLNNAGVTEIQDLQGQYLLKCPFHEDWNPSFRIRLHEHNYHCFSCNDFGSIAKLMYKLSSQSIPQVSFYEQLLKSNPAMQQQLGFNSLFIDGNSLDAGFNSRRRFSAREHIGGGMPLSVFTRRVKAAGDTWENFVFSLTLLQSGESLENIVAQVEEQVGYKRSAKGEAEEISLLSLIDSESEDTL